MLSRERTYKARKIARTIYGLRVIGSARVLVEAKRHGMLDSIVLRQLCKRCVNTGIGYTTLLCSMRSEKQARPNDGSLVS